QFGTGTRRPEERAFMPLQCLLCFLPQLATGPVRGAGNSLQYVAECGRMCYLACYIFRHRDVGHHAGPFPVRASERVDRLGRGYGQAEDPLNQESVSVMGAAAGCFADYRRPLAVLQGVGEGLRAGEGLTARQEVEWLAEVAGARHVRQRPSLLDALGL